jgi:hypothetical protein
MVVTRCVLHYVAAIGITLIPAALFATGTIPATGLMASVFGSFFLTKLKERLEKMKFKLVRGNA